MPSIGFIYYFKKYKVDILHNNSSNIFIPSFAAQICQIKIIYHIREVWNTRNKLSKVIYYYISRASSKIICITNTVKQGNFSKKDLKKFDNKFVIVTDCIEIEKFHHIINTKSKEEVIVSFVGRIAPIKGLDILLKALSSLNFPDSGFKLKLQVIGDIPKENRFYKSYKKYILELAAKCQVNTNLEIQFYGFRNDVANLLKQSHVLVLPSRIEEGLGLVLAEGLICENFLITSNLGGQKEIIAALGCGLLFENDNHIDLAAKVEYYLSNSSMCNSEIPNGKQSALTLFSPQTYSHLILAIYSKLAC
ncbi:MAG: glycosyltransferase [Chitinophagaceae bacterium]|nr:MAG: glycosyltransferase [Chitinophagaceae bacterium]